MAEATNELTLIGTGLYGKPLSKQDGAPLRLVTAWKYGFKSIVRFTFTDQRPVNFWQSIAASEYGFWANVNPNVPHPRWSQASERRLGMAGSVPTQLFDGYGDFVADLYPGSRTSGCLPDFSSGIGLAETLRSCECCIAASLRRLGNVVAALQQRLTCRQ